MRITPQQIEVIRQTVSDLMGGGARVFLFGSRVDDQKRGGDIDLLVDVTHSVEQPALMMARISARLTRLFEGRRVDVLLRAPNLMVLPIHAVALETGVLL